MGDSSFFKACKEPGASIRRGQRHELFPIKDGFKNLLSVLSQNGHKSDRRPFFGKDLVSTRKVVYL